MNKTIIGTTTLTYAEGLLRNCKVLAVRLIESGITDDNKIINNLKEYLNTNGIYINPFNVKDQLFLVNTVCQARTYLE